MEQVDAELQRLDAGAVRHQGRGRRQLQGAARPAARRRRGRRRWWSASPATTCSTWPGPSCGRERRGARRRRRDRDARGHGPAAGRGGARRGRRRPALRAGRRRRGLRRRIAYLVAPARRERRPGELPPLAVHDRRRARRSGTRAARASRPPSPTATTVGTDAAPRTRTARTERRPFDPDAPFANEPDTDFTPAANRAWIAAPPRRDDRPADRCRALRHDDGAASTSIVAPGPTARRGRRLGARPSTAERRRGAAPGVRRGQLAADRGRDDRRDGPRGGQDGRRGRPRGLRGDRLRPLGRRVHPRARRPRRRRRGRRAARRRARRRAVELPVRRSRPAACSPRWPPATPCSSSRRPRPWPRRSSWSATLHEAGVPDDVVQLVPCPDDDVGRRLVTHPGVDAVVLTGSYDTAQLFLGWKPDAAPASPRRAARTPSSITPAADLDLALARPRALGLRPRRPEVLGGQPGHRRGAAATTTPASSAGWPTPCAACASGRPTDLATTSGPLIAPAAGPLARALDRARRRRVVARRAAPARRHGRLWSPGRAPRRAARARGSTRPSASGRCSA